MKVILPVPFVSQYSLPRDKDGLSRACGIACLKMIIDFRAEEPTRLDDLLQESELVSGAYIPGIGWAHASLAIILRNHNIGAYPQEFRSVYKDIVHRTTLPSPYESLHIERGIRKIAGKIKEGKPAIISGIKGWNEADKSRLDKIHLMVFMGFEKNDKEEIQGFYFHDPDDEKSPGSDKYIDINVFRKLWRKFAIFID